MSEQQLLISRTKEYLAKFQTPKTVIAKAVNLSYPYFFCWLKGEVNISEEAQGRIKTYLSERGY